MIDHLRSNKGKEFMYILPVNKFDDYIILKVQTVNIHNTMSQFKILEVIREETGNGIFTYVHTRNIPVWGSNKNLFPITNKFKEGE